MNTYVILKQHALACVDGEFLKYVHSQWSSRDGRLQSIPGNCDIGKKVTKYNFKIEIGKKLDGAGG